MKSERFAAGAYLLAILLVGCAKSTLIKGGHMAECAIAGWDWLGESIAYPFPKSGEDTAVLAPLSGYFSKAGLRVRGDTYPMTWADDGEIYASAGDPHWGGKNDGLDFEVISGTPPDYRISRVSPMSGYRGNGGEGVKPTGLISVNGVLYLAFQNLLGKKPPTHGDKSQHGSDAMIVRSTDQGKTWTPDIKDIREPMFPGSRFGGPAFVNYGRDNLGARGGYVYAVSTDQWDNGSELRVGRVPLNQIMNVSSWEWVAGMYPDGSPRWTPDLDQSVPVLSDDRRISLPDMVYIARIRRYLLLTWHLHGDFSSEAGTELMIYESPEPWGPFTMVHHEAMWESPEVNPYCPRLPLKWLQETPAGIEGWLQFSGSWRENSAHYCSHVRKFRIRLNPGV
jgi:hypothetical protein